MKYKTPAIIGYNCHPLEVFISEANRQKVPLKIIRKRPNSFEEDNNNIVKEAVNQLNQIFPKCKEKKMFQMNYNK